MSPTQIVSLAEALQAKTLNRDTDTATPHPVVLIVDDEKIIANTLTAIFNRSGYTAFAAYDATSALELATLITPELLITDVVMPGMNGIDLAITMEAFLPSCKILLFSGQASTLDLLAGARAMGHDFTTLTKPVHPTELLRHVSESLQGARSPQLAASSLPS